jgi:outer membrane receptor protein involved in Fe transport
MAAGGYVDLSLRRGRFEANPGLALVTHPFLYTPSVEPRFRFAWQPNLLRGGAFSGAAGLYYQTLVGVTDERDAGSLFMAWMPAPISGRKSRSAHGLLGWKQPLARWADLSVEAYYKVVEDLAIPVWSTIARFTTALQLADGTSYGYDARLELDHGPFYLFGGYGFSVTEYEASQDNFGIWYGEPVQTYHPPHDLRHQVTLVAGYNYGRSAVNLQWQFGSGLPYTRALGFDELVHMWPLMDYRRFSGTTRILFEKPYLGRLPSYHRLDVSVERQFTFDRMDVTLQAGAVNSYDRQNIFYLDIFTLRRVDQLPLVPFAGIKLDLR